MHRVIRQLRLNGRVHRVLVIHQEQRVTIGRGMLGDFGGVNAGRTGAIVRDGLLLPHLGEAPGQQARKVIRGAARLRGHDNADGAAGETGVVACRLRV